MGTHRQEQTEVKILHKKNYKCGNPLPFLLLLSISHYVTHWITTTASKHFWTNLNIIYKVARKMPPLTMRHNLNWPLRHWALLCGKVVSMSCVPHTKKVQSIWRQLERRSRQRTGARNVSKVKLKRLFWRRFLIYFLKVKFKPCLHTSLQKSVVLKVFVLEMPIHLWPVPNLKIKFCKFCICKNLAHLQVFGGYEACPFPLDVQSWLA